MRSDSPRFVRIARYRIRRTIRRIDRAFPGWAGWIPSCLFSLLVHSAMLFMLALYYFTTGGPADPRALSGETLDTRAPIGENVTSLVTAERSGDPFTTEDSELAPSLGTEPLEIASSATSQPEAPIANRAGPIVLGSGIRLPGIRLSEVVQSPFTHIEDMSAPFSGRSAAKKAALVRRQGGTVESEAAVAAGIDWLARHQKEDGSWSLEYHGQCRDGGCPIDVSPESDTAATGLALLPMLGAGYSHTEKSPFQQRIHKGLDWLVKRQQPSGELYTGGGVNFRMYSHAIATMALCEAYGLTEDKRLRAPAQRAIDFIEKSQNAAGGGWRYYPGQAGDTSVFGWQMFALRSARLSGLNVSKRVIQGCRAYLDIASADPRKTTYSYQPNRSPSPVMTAEALLCRQYLGWSKDNPILVQGAAIVARDLFTSNDRNIYYWYYATQMLHNMQNKDWKDWNVRVRDGLVETQISGIGCSRGSWDPMAPQPDRWGRRAGRLYETSLSVLTLEVYYRFLPLYRVTGGTEDDAESDDPNSEMNGDPAAKPPASSVANSAAAPKAKVAAPPAPAEPARKSLRETRKLAQ